MRRRHVLAMLGCGVGLGLTGLAWPRPVSNRRAAYRMPLFIGLGNGGVNFIQGLPKTLDGELQEFPFISAELNRSDGESARPLPVKEHIRIVESAVFRRHAEEVSRVVLMAGMSRSTGGELITDVAERYLAQGADVTAVVTLPFHFEGRSWRVPAERQLERLLACGCEVSVIDNAAVVAGLSGSITLLQAFQATNRKVFDAAASVAWPMATILHSDSREKHDAPS